MSTKLTKNVINAAIEFQARREEALKEYKEKIEEDVKNMYNQQTKIVGADGNVIFSNSDPNRYRFMKCPITPKSRRRERHYLRHTANANSVFAKALLQ